MRILLSRTDALGDAVVTSAFIESLSKMVANLKLDILCHNDNLPAFKFHPLVNKIYVLNHRPGTRQLASNWHSIIATINQNPAYDLILQLNGCIRAYFYVSKIKAKQVIARRLITKSIRSRLRMLKHKYSGNFSFFNENVNQHEVLRLHQFLDYIVIRLRLNANYTLPASVHFYPMVGYERSNIIKGSIILNASGKKSVTRYMNDSLLYSLIIELSGLAYTKISIIAIAEDYDRVKRVITATQMEKQITLIIEPDIYVLAQKIASYEFFIGVDGGLTHIAAGLGLKCVTLFDKQDSQIWHPWSPTQISLQTQSKNIYDISYFDIIDSLSSLGSKS